MDGDVIQVRMLANWCSSGELRELFNRMTTEGNYEWRFSDLDGAERRLRITAADDEKPDYWVVIVSIAAAPSSSTWSR